MFSGLVVVVVIGLYFWQGPVRQSKAILPPVRIETVTSPPVVRPPQKGSSKAPKPSVPPHDLQLLNRLAKEQSVRAKAVQHATGKVSPKLVDYLKREGNYLPELDKAASELLPGSDGKMTRLKIHSIDSDSILTSKLGLQNNDIIEYIDGERIDFKGDSSMAHLQRKTRLMEKLENGGSISLTITRNGQPMEIEFKLE